MKRFASIAIEILFYAAIAGGVLWGLPEFLSWKLGTPYPIAGVTSSSMWPALKRGDLILIKGVERSDIQKNDIVVWKHGGGFTIHRVVELNQKTLVTKGDGNFDADEPVRYEDVVGKALTVRGRLFRIPYAGFVTITAQSFAYK
ncbi:MAG: signal peptidase, endoplasmic reticulum-type [Parcubacteria group bacterium Gr01-1014_70]|nr:MAG: signal peptidase, endoplasmic reticulum-type [Parcubacteria group bacterium Gr01-1014_70]